MNKKYKLQICIIILILLIILTLSITYLGYIQKLTHENTLKNLGELTKQDAVKIENQISQHKKILENLTNQIQEIKDISENEIFEIYNKNIASEEFSRLAIMHEDGSTITSDGEEVDLSQDIENFFGSEDIQLSKSRKSKVDQEEINIYSKKINIKNKNVAILLVVETDKYENIFVESIYEGRGHEYIITSDGEVIANSKKEENGKNMISSLEEYKTNENEKVLAKMKTQISNKENGQIRYNFLGNHLYISYRYLNINDWYLVIITSGNIIAEELNTSLRFTFVVAIIVNTIIALTSIYIVISNKKQKEKLYKLAYVDKLTKLGNGNYFLEKGNLYLNELDFDKYKYYMIILDIDKFKTLNKKYGRKIGDKILIEIAKKLEKISNKKDMIISRLVNDSFGILMKFNNNIEEKIEEIIENLSDIEIEKRKYNIILSVGIYELKKGEKNIFNILDKTLIAHSKAKGIYNKKYFIFNEKMEHKLVEEHEIETNMENAIINNEFKIYYQPKINAKTNKIVAAEALVRWEKEDKIIMPNQFIPIFEKNGFIIKLDKYIYEKVCKDIAEWKEKNNKEINVSINVSKEHLVENFIEEYNEIAESNNLDTNKIELEITESAGINDEIDLLSIMKEIKKYGFLISIDDFGTGYSSLNMLQNMPIDILKIDKSFINQDKMLESIILIAKKMNLKTVAEGVETEEQVEKLKKLGVDLLQGYFYSKPLPKTEFEKYIENN